MVQRKLDLICSEYTAFNLAVALYEHSLQFLKKKINTNLSDTDCFSPLKEGF